MRETGTALAGHGFQPEPEGALAGSMKWAVSAKERQ